MECDTLHTVNEFPLKETATTGIYAKLNVGSGTYVQATTHTHTHTHTPVD